MALTVERYVSVLHPFARFSRLLLLKACIFAQSFSPSLLPMLRSFAVYTIPVVVFALAWNIPRFGEPTSLLHFSSFKSIFPEPVDLFFSGELTTCYAVVNTSQEWRGVDNNATDIEAEPSNEVKMKASICIDQILKVYFPDLAS